MEGERWGGVGGESTGCRERLDFFGGDEEGEGREEKEREKRKEDEIRWGIDSDRTPKRIEQ